MNNLESQILPYFSQLLKYQGFDVNDEKRNAFLNLIKSTINLNEDYSGLFYRCMEEVIAKEEDELTMKVSLLYSKPSIFKTLPPEIFLKIVILVKDIHLLNCDKLSLNINELEILVNEYRDDEFNYLVKRRPLERAEREYQKFLEIESKKEAKFNDEFCDIF